MEEEEELFLEPDGPSYQLSCMNCVEKQTKL